MPLAGCMVGPDFLKQSDESNVTGKTVAVEGKGVEGDEGAVVGEFKAGSLTSQVLTSADDSNVQGASISIAPNSLAIDTNVTIQEGAAITSDSVVQEVSGDSSLAVASASNAVLVSSDQSVDLAQPMTVAISIPPSSSLTAGDASALVVFYKVFKAAEGAWVQGFLAKDKVEISGSVVRFLTNHFGTFQAVYLTAPPSDSAKEVPAAGKAISKKEEKTLPAVAWGAIKAGFNAGDRTITISIAASGHQDIDFCELIGDADQLPPFDLRQKTGNAFAVTVAVGFDRADSLTFRWSCVEKSGRLSQSGWSDKLDIPAKESKKDDQQKNLTPTISLSSPPAAGASVKQNTSYAVSFSAADADDEAKIALYYKSSNSDCSAGLTGWTRITGELKEGIDTSYTWSLSGVATGTWYLCAYISDGRGGEAWAASQGAVTILAAPTVSLTSAQTSPTNAASINMTATFSHAVSGFDLSDISVSNGTASGFTAVDGRTYSFNIAPLSGVVSVSVPAGSATDAAGNPNAASLAFSITSDNTAPTVTLTSTQTSPTNSSTINMTVTFSEVVTGFVLSDLNVVGGTKGNFVAQSGSVYTFDITSPAASVTVDVAGAAASDAAGNSSIAASQFSIAYDGTAPTVTLSAGQTSPTNATTINMTAQFSETVTGFTLSDISAVGGTAGNFVAVDGDTFTFDLTSPSGNITVDIAANSAQDNTGNYNIAASQFNITYDGAAPTVVLSSTQSSPTNASTINMTAQFSETVTGFTLADITVTGGIKGNFVAVDGDTYTFDITSPSGTVTVDVAGSVAQDAASNNNTAATQFSIVYDSTAPTVTLSATQISPTNAATINMTVQFSEDVTGFTLSDITVVNGTKDSFVAVDGDTYTFNITSPSGTVTVDVAGGVAKDLALNNNIAATQFSIVYDSSAPTVVLTSTQSDPTNATTINMTAQFSEAVTGFDLTDITVTGGTKGNFVAVDGDTYTFDITSPSGTVTVDVAGAVAQDSASNNNTAAIQFTIVYDSTAPTVTLSATQLSPTNASTINMTVQFSETVTGFDLSDITVANGAKDSFVAVDGDTYTFNITSPSGTVTVDVAGAVAKDLALNNNVAATQFSIIYDSSAPTVVLTSTQSDPTNATTINMTAQFSEAVTGFDLTDITVTGGTKGNFVAVDGDTYTFDITSPSGSVTVDVDGAVAQDAAGNNNTAATQFSIVYDGNAPSVVLSASQTSPTNSSTVNMTAEFSEDVTGFDLTDISVSNATAGNFAAVDGNTYTFDLTSLSGTVSVDVAGGVASDTAGNSSTAATQFNIIFDSSAPGVTLSAIQGSPTNSSTINMTAEFSEDVTGFDISDIGVSNGTAGNFAAVDANTYTFDITSPTGTVLVDVAAGVAQDLAGNNNTAATQFSIVYDTTAPTVTITSAQGAVTTSATINLTVVFSEDVSGFDLTDITVTGGTKGGFSSANAFTYYFDVTSITGNVVITIAGGVATDTAGNSNNSGTTTVVTAPDLTNPGLQEFTVNMLSGAAALTNSGAAVSSCSMTPSLPAGLSVGTVGSTCRITGTPTEAASRTTYTLTASTVSAVSDTIAFEIAVLMPGDVTVKAPRRITFWDSTNSLHWAVVHESGTIKFYKSLDGQIWTFAAGYSVPTSEISVTSKSGQAVVVWKDGLNINLQRFSLTSGVVTSVEGPIVALAGASPSNEWSMPTVAIDQNDYLHLAAYQAAGSPSVKVPRSVVSGGTFTSGSMTFSAPYNFGVPVGTPEGIALVPYSQDSNKVMAVLKGQRDQVRAYAFDGTGWKDLPASGGMEWWGFNGVNAPNGVVRAMAVMGNDLYVGGQFTDIGGDGTLAGIARWDGISWHQMNGGLTGGGSILAMTVMGGNLYVGGIFSSIGGVSANNVAKWNGTSWISLGSGNNGVNNAVYAMTNDGTYVYVGGSFTSAGGSAASKVALWTGSTWTGIGSGLDDGNVFAMTHYNSYLHIGGDFTSVGSNANCRLICFWTGSAWSGVGLAGITTGLDVSALAVMGSDLIVGGNFVNHDSNPNANHLVRWNGSSWSALGSGMSDAVKSLTVRGSDLFAGGNFINAGGTSASKVARWNGTSWSALQAGVNNIVWSLQIYASDLFVGGNYTQANALSAGNLAQFSGGIVAKAKSFSLSGYATGALLGYIDAGTGVPFVRDLNGAVWGSHEQLDPTASLSGQIQVATSDDNARKFAVWHQPDNQIFYKYYNSGWGSVIQLSNSGTNSVPWIPSVIGGTATEVPVIWYRSDSPNKVETGVVDL